MAVAVRTSCKYSSYFTSAIQIMIRNWKEDGKEIIAMLFRLK